MIPRATADLWGLADLDAGTIPQAPPVDGAQPYEAMVQDPRTGTWYLPSSRAERDRPPRPEIIPLASICTDPPPPLLIDRLDPEGHTILYGTGGIGKGALASWWITRLVAEGQRVLILDYEGHPTEWARRIASLDPAATAGVSHLTPAGSLRDVAESIRHEADALEITYVIVDSAVMASGDDPMKPDAARSYGEGVIRLGRPVLTLAHVTKFDDARYPFGSIFWHNLARTTWSLTADGDKALLSHRKHNNYAAMARQSIVMTWTDGQLREVWERPYAASLADEIVEVLTESPNLTVPEIVAALEGADGHADRKVNRGSVDSALKRGVGPMGRFTCRQTEGKPRWSLSA